MLETRYLRRRDLRHSDSSRAASARIDSHHHLWRYSAEDYGWIGEDMAALCKDYLLPELTDACNRSSVTGTTAVPEHGKALMQTIALASSFLPTMRFVWIRSASWYSKVALMLLPLTITALCAQMPSTAQQARRTIQVNAAQVIGPMTSTPLRTIGAGRANEGLRADWQGQLSIVQAEIGFSNIRFHGVLSDDMGVYSEAKNGNPVYNFQYVDKLYDALLARHIRPFVELAFMPSALASGTTTIFWWRGNVTPPKDWDKWSALVEAFVRHLEQRYGHDEVRQWYFEVWNEPDLPAFFTGTMQDYFHLYDISAHAVRSVCPDCKVGGPASAAHWEREFLDHVKEAHTPIDFLSTHTYASAHGYLDVDGKMGSVFRTDQTAIVGRVQASHGYIQDSGLSVELHYTEWSSSGSGHDPLHDQYLQASFILDRLRKTSALAQSMSYWTFTDIFEEGGPPKRPFTGCFGLINLQGIRKSAFFAYKYLHALGPDSLQVSDSAANGPDLWATRKGKAIQVLLWDYTPIDTKKENDLTFFARVVPAKPAPGIDLTTDHLSNGRWRVLIYRTGFHKNDPYTAYLEQGAPADLSREQVKQLEKLTSDAPTMLVTKVVNGKLHLPLDMMQNDIVLVELTPMP